MRGAALCALVYGLVLPAVGGAATLFPSPIHITRQVQDPISGTTNVINEYGYGNRLISTRAGVTSIADYEKGVLTQIDRDAGTYSVTSFDALAKAGRTFGVAPASSPKSSRPPRSVGAKITKSGQTAEYFEVEVDSQTIEVAIDRTVLVSKDALEVLIGSAYPGTKRSDHEAVISAASSVRGASTPSSAALEQYGLPVEQTVRYQIDGKQVEFRNNVIRVAAEPPPADLVSIPAGARLVVSRIVAVARELELLDQTLTPPRKP